MIDEIQFRNILKEKSIEYLEKAKAGRGGGFEILIDVAVGISLGEVVKALDKTHKKDKTTSFPQ